MAISFILNGRQVTLDARADATVLDTLRNRFGLKGTKEGCAEGDCGACTVLVSRQGINNGRPNAANACIMTLAQIDGAAITTVEGLAQNGTLSALQEAMAENGSSQCGFCTPGIAVALTGLLQSNPSPDEADIHDALAGNLCRCTGYKPIVEAAKKAAGSIATPQAIVATGQLDAQSFGIEGSKAHRPNTLGELLDLRAKMPDAVLLAGGTDLGVPLAAYETRWDDIILTGAVAELRAISETPDGWTFGAAVTWSEVLGCIEEAYPSFATLIRRFGSTQIRAMGTIGGNIGTASPIGDGPPALIALGAQINLAAPDGSVEAMALEDFFLDYRKTALKPGGVIVSVFVPKPKEGEVFRVYKVSKRYDQDISTVCGAFHLALEDGKIKDARCAYGGMAGVPKRATHLEQALDGITLDAASARQAAEVLVSDFQPLSDWRGTADYRMSVAKALVERLARDLAGETVEVMAQ